MSSKRLSNGRGKIHVLEVLGNAIVGGMETYVRNLIDRLPADRFRVTCLCPYQSDLTAELEAMGCEVFVTYMATDPPWRSIQTAVEVVRSQNIDLLHAHLYKAHMLAGLAGSLTGRPVVATVHGMALSPDELAVSQTTNSHLVVVCQEAYIHARSLGVPAERLTAIANGVDMARYRPAADGNAFRDDLGIPSDAPLVGFVGRIAWEKGPDQFMHVARHVHGNRPDVHFVLVGEGHMSGDVARMVEEMALSERVHMAGMRRDTWNVYPALDVMVQTSRTEGMPLALLEAMACGKPIVAMTVGGVLELVEVGTTGLISAPGDWEGTGNGVLALLSQPERLARMGEAARRRAEAHYDLAETVRRTARLFRDLVPDKAGQLADPKPINGTSPKRPLPTTTRVSQ